MENKTSGSAGIVPEDVLSRWQTILDLLAELMHVSAALIMRLVDEDIEVFVSSRSEGNPYSVGDREHFAGSGLYCETVIRTKKMLLVANASRDDKWKNNPDIKQNMISYLGFPILTPDGKPFGTICVLDKKDNSYSSAFTKLMENFRYIIESQLAVLFMNQRLGDENKRLNDYISEIRVLRGMLPICSLCKKIRIEDGSWQQIEQYVSKRSEAKFSHTFCPECYEKWLKQQCE